MGGRKNIEQKKNKRSRQISSMMEGVYSRAWLMEEEERFRKCKRVGKWVRRKIKCRSKKARKDKCNKRKEIPERNTTGEVYGKVVVWMEQWEVQERISEKVRKKLTKVEVSFFREETLKGGDVRVARNKLSYFLIFLLFLLFFQEIFLFLYF